MDTRKGSKMIELLSFILCGISISAAVFAYPPHETKKILVCQVKKQKTYEQES
jgi:hypothetical protein